MTAWALDLGTTNCGVACWDEALGRPRLIELPAVCRKLDAKDPLEAPRLVPSAVHLLRSRAFSIAWEAGLHWSGGSYSAGGRSSCVRRSITSRGRSILRTLLSTTSP